MENTPWLIYGEDPNKHPPAKLCQPKPKIFIPSHGSYPNKYEIFTFLIRISETQASEFLGRESNTWNIEGKEFVLFLANHGILGIYESDGQLWLISSQDKELEGIFRFCSDDEDEVHEAVCKYLRELREKLVREAREAGY